MTILDELTEETREFARRRDWTAVHTPKNLSMAVASEAGELVAELRWLSDEASRREDLTALQREAIRLEMADVLIFLLRLGVTGHHVGDTRLIGGWPPRELWGRS